MSSINIPDNSNLPVFSDLLPENIPTMINDILTRNRQSISQITSSSISDWESLIKPLSLMEDRLSKAWSPVSHLNSVLSSDGLRAAYENCLPGLSEYATEMGQNAELFQAYRSVRQSDEFCDLDEAQQKAITDALKHFVLAGIDLDPADQKTYQLLQKDLSDLQSSFENNVLDSNQSWQLVVESEQQLSGLPDYALAMLKQSAQQKNLEGYRISLDMPCYIAVITYADDPQLRKAIYQAYTTRASEIGITDKKWDNGSIMAEILQKRQQKAQLLGFKNYAEYSLETKMANNITEVIHFLEDLAQRSRDAAIAEVNDRQTFAESLGHQGELQAWDYAYYSEKLKQQRYQISDEDLKPYFADDRVIAGLFEIVRKLYDISIVEITQGIDLWHPSVRFYQIADNQGEVIGQFYLDLYARENKRGGAWMDECINRYRFGESLQIPVAYLTCNLTPPIGDEPALFTHDEVITLFHEFGHGLHHMLTRIDVPDVAGINGVEWDAVELPSQFMENFCWQREALDLFARHYQTGEALPDSLFDKMIEAKNFQSALQMLRQLEFSLFDIRIHMEDKLDDPEKIQHLLDGVRQQVSVVKTPADNRFQNGFSHIFAGGYAAGYYSYKWAEVLSADAFAAFEEEGIFNSETGKRFLDCILEKGGSRPALQSFQAFRGRSPKIEALLRHSGIQ